MSTDPSNSIERRPPRLHFQLQDMGLIYEQADGQTDVPHRHDYYTVLLVQTARGDHIVDYQTYAFDHLQVHFISPGQIHQVALSEKPVGWVITFSREFLVQNNIPERFISNISLFRSFQEAPPLQLDEATYDRLYGIIQEMQACLAPELEYRTRALGLCFNSF